MWTERKKEKKKKASLSGLAIEKEGEKRGCISES